MAERTTVFVDEASDAISQAASNVKDQATRAGQAVVDKVEQTRDAAAGALHNASEAIHSQADRLPRGRQLAHSAADKLDSAAGYMAEHDTSEIIADAGSFMQRNPGKTLVLGMVIGCTIGWLLRRK